MNERKRADSSLLPIIALLASAFLWGGSFPSMRFLLRTLDPWTVMWLRMTLASLAILPAAKSLKFRSIRKKDWKFLIPMVLFQPCLYFLLEANALRLTTSTQAGVISAAVPLLVSLGAWLFLAEKLSLRLWAGLFLSIAGVIVLTLAGRNGGEGSHILLGNTMELAAMFCAAASMVIIKILSDRYNPWTLTALQSFTGSLFFLPGLGRIFTQKSWPLVVEGLPLILYLGIFVSLGAFGLYNWGMSRIKASSASSFINLVPVTAVLLGWTLLGESLNSWQSLASVLVIGGVWLSQEGQRRRRTAKKVMRIERL